MLTSYMKVELVCVCLLGKQSSFAAPPLLICMREETNVNDNIMFEICPAVLDEMLYSSLMRFLKKYNPIF